MSFKLSCIIVLLFVVGISVYVDQLRKHSFCNLTTAPPGNFGFSSQRQVYARTQLVSLHLSLDF